MTSVYVLYGGVGGDNAHVEIFADTKRGQQAAVNRMELLKSWNIGWRGLKLERHIAKEGMETMGVHE